MFSSQCVMNVQYARQREKKKSFYGRENEGKKEAMNCNGVCVHGGACYFRDELGRAAA